MSALQPAGEFFNFNTIELPPQNQMVASGAIWGLFGSCMEMLYPASTPGLFTAAAAGFGVGEELGEAYLKSRFSQKYSFLNPLISSGTMAALLVGGAALSDQLPMPARAAVTAGYLFALTVSLPKIFIASPCYSRVLSWLSTHQKLV